MVDAGLCGDNSVNVAGRLRGKNGDNSVNLWDTAGRLRVACGCSAGIIAKGCG